jgi:hypothetical protein
MTHSTSLLCRGARGRYALNTPQSVARRLRMPLLAVLAPPPVAGVPACVSCGETPPVKPAPPPVTDTKPVGEGLKVIGFALLGAAVVGVLGRLMTKPRTGWSVSC